MIFHTDSNASASFRPPRLSSPGVAHAQAQASKSALADASSPPRTHFNPLEKSHELHDELPPPVFSAPPASIPLVPSQTEPSQPAPQAEVVMARVVEAEFSNGIAVSQLAAAGTAHEDHDPLFHFGFSQMPGVIQGLSEGAGDTSMTEANTSDEQFALNFSQMVDTQAMTQL